ncbi:MAG TPA: pyruvate dehydrogenase (acetyl-transferring) E1 component subunit alpha [Candidatus Angelobacter sp.]|nr:pyruvate dehydrogenase (acetyl-transferring) E1 component subunit alpha [Candidatus Angelobacter sp.]
MEAVETRLFAAVDINQRLIPDEKIQLLRQMFRIRRFEQTALKYYQTGAMGGFLHLYIGQESVAVGTISLCNQDDQIVAGYRSHGHALASGMSMNDCMAELFGKATGCSKGKGGSMHLFAPDKNYWGGHGIVAGQTPLGLGLAFALKYKNVKGCCLCYLGDGAVNQGVYHESLNLASLWNLPVIYIIENNQYSMGTSLERSSAYKDCLAARAEGYNIKWNRINGEAIYEIRARTWEAMESARNESRPSVLEIATYRYYGHSVSDAMAKKYRDPAEIEKYRQFHDPLRLWQRRLLEEEIVSQDQIAELDAAAQAEADAAVEFAKSSPLPEPQEIFSDVYYEVDRQTAAGRTGKHFFND